MTFLEKKFQGRLKICLRNDLFFVKLKSEQKNFKNFKKIFLQIPNFQVPKTTPENQKFKKKILYSISKCI